MDTLLILALSLNSDLIKCLLNLLLLWIELYRFIVFNKTLKNNRIGKNYLLNNIKLKQVIYVRSKFRVFNKAITHQLPKRVGVVVILVIDFL